MGEVRIINWIVNSWSEVSKECILNWVRKSGIINAITADAYDNTNIDKNSEFYVESPKIPLEFECFSTFKDNFFDNFDFFPCSNFISTNFFK